MGNSNSVNCEVEFVNDVQALISLIFEETPRYSSERTREVKYTLKCERACNRRTYMLNHRHFSKEPR